MTEDQRRAYIARRTKHGRSESRTHAIKKRWESGIPKKKMIRNSKKGMGQKSSYGRGRRR